MTRLSRILILAFVGLFVIAGPRIGHHAAAQTTPNFVVIMTDDLSEDLLQSLLDSGYGPNTQQYLIDEGIRFENSFVSNALCCPSRATFLRGEYSHNHRVLDNRASLCEFDKKGIEWPGWFPSGETPGKNESTIATWLQASGYTTGHVGRYLTGYGLAAPEGEPDPKLYIPPGWDSWQGLIDTTTFKMYDFEINDNGSVATYGSEETDYQTDVLSDLAVQFIDDRAADQQPFFLFVGTFAPHVELVIPARTHCGAGFDPLELRIRPAPRHEHLIDEDGSNGELPALVPDPSFNEADLSDKPSCPPDADPDTYDPTCTGNRPLLQAGTDIPNLVRQHKSMLAAMIAVDDLVGSVVSSLQANGLDDETILLFTSDNGWLFGEHRVVGKYVAFEDSIRVPLLMRAPGFASNAVASQLVINNDLAPTLAELAGATPTHSVDGTSLVPLLEDPQITGWHRRNFLVEHWFIPEHGLATYFALRILNSANDFLYVTTQAEPETPNSITHREFYDMNSDPYQMRSLSPPQAVTDALDSFISQFRTCSGASCQAFESAF